MSSSTAEQFRQREKRFVDAIRLEVTDRVPLEINVHFDTTDMFRAKDVLGGHLCISGNVPVSLLAVGTPDEVRDVAKRLIDYCGRDGGFVMSSRTPVDDARPENLKALIDFTIEYGGTQRVRGVSHPPAVTGGRTT